MQRINSIHFYKGMLVPSIDLENPKVKYVLDRLAMGESAGLKNKKLRGHYIWKARIDDCNRLLYTMADIKGERRIVVLTVTAHKYDTCPFLQPDYLRNFIDHNAVLYDRAVTEEDFDTESDGENEMDINNNNNVISPKFEYIPIDSFNGKLIALSDDQIQVKYRTLPLVVMGPAGSGKSCNALSMINDFVAEQVGAKEIDEIIYVTQSPALCESMRNNWRSYPLSQQFPAEKVRFVTYQELVASPLVHVGFDEFRAFIDGYTKKIRTQLKVKQKNEAISLDWVPVFTRDKKLSVQLIYQEMRIISGCSSLEEYQSEYGSDQSLTPKAQRKSLFEIYQQYLAHLTNHGKIDLGCCMPLMKPRKARLLIDEAQDLAHVQLKLLCDYSRGEIVYFFDPRQSLSDTLKKKHYTDRILNVKNSGAKPVELKSSYRCPKAILDIAQEMLFLGAKLTGEAAPQAAVSMLDHPGAVSVLEKIPENLDDFVVVTLPDLVEKAKADYKTNRVFTIDQIKGLEYKHIVAHCIFDNEIYFQACAELVAGVNKNKVFGPAFFRAYTAFTRAIETVTIVENNPDCLRKLGPIMSALRKPAVVVAKKVVTAAVKKKSASRKNEELFEEVKQLLATRNKDNFLLAKSIWVDELKKQPEDFIKFKQQFLGEMLPQWKALMVELNKVDDEISVKQKYMTHYRFEVRLEKLMEKPDTKMNNAKLPSECRKLIRDINEKLNKLEQANKDLIKQIDFFAECHRLISLGEKNEFTGLIDIAEYFGLSHISIDVLTALERVLAVYQASPSKRTPQTKGCLDYLCQILHVNKLTFATSVSSSVSIFPSQKEIIDAIIEKDNINELRQWIKKSTKTDREYALRVAISYEISGYNQCISHLLDLTSPEAKVEEHISLISQGAASGQCALHRAIALRSPSNVNRLLRCPSNDVLRQLLIKDKKHRTPIDDLVLIFDTKYNDASSDDKHNLYQIVFWILITINQNQSNRLRALSPEDETLIKSKLGRLQFMHESHKITSKPG